MKSLNIIYNKVKANILLSLTCSLLPLGFLFTSCESREQLSYGDGATPLSSPAITVSDTQYNSLTFKWESVADAVEYGYTLTDANGDVIDGGLTKVDSVKFEDLTHSTNYTFHLYAYAKVLGEKTTSAEATLAVTTPFWPAVNTTGTYASELVSSTTKSWSVGITEARTEEGAFGTFTVSSWYNHSGYDLEFTVNEDSTITVLNGTRDDSEYVTVLAGASNIKTDKYVRKGVQIYEKDCRFDRTNQLLRLKVRSIYDPTVEGVDSLTWE